MYRSERVQYQLHHQISTKTLSSLQLNRVINNFYCGTNISFPCVYYYNNNKLITIGENRSFSTYIIYQAFHFHCAFSSVSRQFSFARLLIRSPFHLNSPHAIWFSKKLYFVQPPTHSLASFQRSSANKQNMKAKTTHLNTHLKWKRAQLLLFLILNPLLCM